jgi:hypothetical protein
MEVKWIFPFFYFLLFGSYPPWSLDTLGLFGCVFYELKSVFNTEKVRLKKKKVPIC